MTIEAGPAKSRGSYFISGDKFVKEYCSGLEIEFEKATKIHELARRSGVFCAPTPLECDPLRSTISYQRFDDGFVSIRELFFDFVGRRRLVRGTEGIFRNVGIALANIHSHLELTTYADWQPPSANLDVGATEQRDDIGRPGEGSRRSFMHCDFGFSNILVMMNPSKTGVEKLLIIDSSPNFFMTTEPDTYGPIEVDIANFVACLHGLVPLHRQFGCDWDRAARLKQEFVGGYESFSGRDIDATALREMVDLTLRTYLGQRISNRLLRRAAIRLVLGKRRVNSMNKDAP